MIGPLLAARDVSVAPSGRPVLRRVNLEVGPAQLVALLGTNGSGKTTLVRACLGLVPLTSGSVHLFGQPIVAMRQWWRLGYVPQRPDRKSVVQGKSVDL